MTTPTRDSRIWVSCLQGREPAESLTTGGRARLVELLAARGWSVLQIAELTRMTEYTTARIQDRITEERLRASLRPPQPDLRSGDPRNRVRGGPRWRTAPATGSAA